MQFRGCPSFHPVDPGGVLQKIEIFFLLQKPERSSGLPQFPPSYTHLTLYSRSVQFNNFLPSPLRLALLTMPGLDYFSSSDKTSETVAAPEQSSKPGVYYNPRLDPKNYLDGPLSTNAATRLRQMLARPGIVVRRAHCLFIYVCIPIMPVSCCIQIAPGICDGISARCALEAGFDCLYQRCVMFVLFE